MGNTPPRRTEKPRPKTGHLSSCTVLMIISSTYQTIARNVTTLAGVLLYFIAKSPPPSASCRGKRHSYCRPRLIYRQEKHSGCRVNHHGSLTSLLFVHPEPLPGQGVTTLRHYPITRGNVCQPKIPRLLLFASCKIKCDTESPPKKSHRCPDYPSSLPAIPPVPGGIGILPAGQDFMQGNALLSYHSAAVVFPYTASAGVIH